MRGPRAALDLVGGALGRLGAFRLVNRVVYPHSTSVLMYHGLVDEPLPVPDWCFVAVERFEEQMRYLAEHFEVVHLETAFGPERPQGGKPLACVTFDDGFASVHDLAFPVLDELGIPATVYLVTDLVDSDRTVWFAQLHQALCETDAKEAVLGDLRLPLGSPEERAHASITLQREIQTRGRGEFAHDYAELLGALGVSDPAAERPWKPFRILTREQIRTMARNDRIRFGAHTASHQILTRTSLDDARREIAESVAAIQEMVDQPSRSFAYPHGAAEDFDEDTIRAVKTAGVDFAVTTIPGTNPPGTDPHAILRYGVGEDYTLSRFAWIAHHSRSAVEELVARVRG